MRVLVVEDAWRLAEAVAEILRGEGWSADVATDGGRGAELAAAGAYDCVLLDVMLPVMGGLDVLRGMREAGDATPGFSSPPATRCPTGWLGSTPEPTTTS